MEGPFSPGFVIPRTEHGSIEKVVTRSAKKTPKPTTPAPGRQVSPTSEFGYDDAYSTNGDEFADGVALKTRLVTRRKSSKSATFGTAKKSFLAPTSCSTVKQRGKACAETPRPVSEPYTGIKAATIPVSPHFRCKPSAGKSESKLTSEDIMLQKLDQEKAQEAERAAKAKKLYAVLKSRASRRSSKLYGRVHGSAVKATPKKERKFVKPRKVSAPAPSVASTVKKGPGGLTLMEPFHFATDKRLAPHAALDADQAVRALPAAELAQHFMRDSRSHGAPENAAQKITVGHSPQLRTKKRGQYAASRPKPPTREEAEAAQMEEIGRHPFKALVLDRRIFDSAGELGVPKVAARPVTEPHEFEFRADKRSAQPRVRDLAASCGSLNNGTDRGAPQSPTKRSSTSFKARPAPKTTGKMPVPRVKTVFKPTIAMSPKFRGGARASVAPERRQRASHASTTTSSTSVVAAVKAKKPTEPKEFKFATSGRSEFHRQQIEKQIAAEEAALAAARERKAAPVPDFSKLAFQPDLVSRKPAPTEPKPFNLRSCARHADAQAAFQQEVQQAAEQSKPAEFHARPVPATNYKPDAVFVEPTNHAPVVPLAVALQSEQRAQKRLAFDQEMAMKMSQLEAMQEAIARQRSEQEHKQLQALRRKSVEEGGLMFKAKPIQTQDQFPGRAPAPLPPTTPLSPHLGTRTRSSVSVRNSCNNHDSSSVAFEVLASASVGDLGKPQRRASSKAASAVASRSSGNHAVLTAALNAM